MAKVKSHTRNVFLSAVVATGIIVAGVLSGFTLLLAALAGYGVAWFLRDAVEVVDHYTGGK